MYEPWMRGPLYRDQVRASSRGRARLLKKDQSPGTFNGSARTLVAPMARGPDCLSNRARESSWIGSPPSGISTIVRMALADGHRDDVGPQPGIVQGRCLERSMARRRVHPAESPWPAPWPD